MKIMLTLIAFFAINLVSAQSYESGLKQTIVQRFTALKGYKRVEVDKGGFAELLRTLTLKNPGTPVLDFRNRVFKEAGDSTVAAVVDFDINGRRLEQCMDILLRFYSNYLITIEKQDSLSFPLPDGLVVSWIKWRQGWRPQFKGLHFSLVHTESHDSTNRNYERFLTEIFSHSGSQTFYHNYPPISLTDLQIGDFIVRKSFKGHAVMIVDMVENQQGQKMVMVGQGDTPACQFYILKNENGSAWFPVDPDSKHLNLPIKKKMYWQGLRRFPAYTD